MRDKRQPTPTNASGLQTPEALAQLVGARIRQARQANGLSQEALAVEMKTRGFNWRQTTVAKAESAARPHLFVEIAALAQILGRDMGYFYSQATLTADLIDRLLTEIEASTAEIDRLDSEASYARERLARLQCAFQAAGMLRVFEETFDAGRLLESLEHLTSTFGARCLEVHYVFEAVGLPVDEVSRLDAKALKMAAGHELSMVETLSTKELESESGTQLLELRNFVNKNEASKGFLDYVRQETWWGELMALLLTNAVVEYFDPEHVFIVRQSQFQPTPTPPMYAQVTGHD